MFLRVLLTCAVFTSVTSKREYVNAQNKNENLYLQVWPKPKPYPFLSRMVSETLNLTCRLINETDVIPGTLHNLSWRIPLNLINNNRVVPFKLNEGIIGLQFLALEESDSGDYTCVSDTFNLKTTTRLVVKPFINKGARKAYCSERMFICPDGLCILERFVCDGRADCPFGADEHSSHCGEDVCLGKIQCNDGRCIPREWCCTKRDVNCTTKVRPDCCDEMQPLVYQEFEGSYLSKQFSKKPNDMDFLHMTIYTIIACALALTIIVLVLVMMLCKAHFREPQCCQDAPGDLPQPPHHQQPPERLYASSFNLAQLLGRYDRVPFRDQCDIAANNNHDSSHRNDNDNIMSRILGTMCCKSFTGRRDVNRAYVTPMSSEMCDYSSTVLGQPRFYSDDRDDSGIHEFIGQPISPPPYCETLQIPPKIGPPPPYISNENISTHETPRAPTSSSVCDRLCDNQHRVINDNQNRMISDNQHRMINDNLHILISNNPNRLVSDNQHVLINDNPNRLISDNQHRVVNDNQHRLITDNQHGVINDNRDRLIIDNPHRSVNDNQHRMVNDHNQHRVIKDNQNKLLVDRVSQPGTSRDNNNSLDDMLYIDCDSENDVVVVDNNRNSNNEIVIANTTIGLMTNVSRTLSTQYRSLEDLTMSNRNVESIKNLTRSENHLMKL